MPAGRIEKFKLNRKGIREILTGAPFIADLEARAQRIAAAAGPGHEVEAGAGKSRARAAVRTATFEAMKAEATSRALTRAIDAGRG